MRDILHDQIDNREELVRQSREITQRVVASLLGPALALMERGELDQLPQILAAIAAEVGARHAALTTKAVGDGAKFAKTLAEKRGRA